MPFAVLAAGGGYKWIQLHDAVSKRDIQVISMLTSSTYSC